MQKNNGQATRPGPLELPRWGNHIEDEGSQARKETMMERAQRSAAKIFAVTYLLSMAILMVVFSRFYAPYLVWENGEETARHFVHHEEAIRIYTKRPSASI